MGDEAVLRIVLDDAGGTAGAAPTAPPNPIAPPTNTPPPRPSSEPVPVKIAKPPPPVPPPAAPPAPPIDWMKSLISPAEGVNPHVLLEGQSGSGKSLAAKHIAFERMKQGQEVNVVDTHTPEAWGGVKQSGGQVFQGATAGIDAAKFLKDALESRKAEATEAKLKGEMPDFKPMTVVFSDFARLMKDTPQLGVEFATLLTEARKFRISIVADTTALTGAASGIKGIVDVRNNFGQQVKFNAPTAQGDPRRAEVAGETYDTPQLPDYKDRIDYSLVQPAKPPPPPPPPEAAPVFDPAAEARKRRESQQRAAQVDAAYKEQYGDRNKKQPADAVLGVVDAMRGTIGGLFGRLAGAAVDVVQGVRKASAAQEDEDYNRQLLSEVPTKAATIPLAAQVPGLGKPEDQALVPSAIPLEPPKTAEVATAVSSLGGAASAAGMAMGVMVPVVGAAVVAFGALTSALDTSVQRYGAVNTEIGRAQGLAEARQARGDVRRGQEYGAELARYVESQSRMQEKFENAKMKLLTTVAPVVEGIFETLGVLADTATATVKVITALHKSISGILTVKIFKFGEDKEDVPDPTETILFKGDPGMEIPEI